MGKFLELERVRQARFKAQSSYFSEAARLPGVFRNRPRDFCVPPELAEENLYPGIREQALRHFQQQNIKWHLGQDNKPINHLCSSQVCCVNFLYPFANQPEALAALLRPLFPDIEKMLPIDSPEQLVTFEWIGKENYLGERVPRGGHRTRGANCTAADAVVMFQRQNSQREIVLIEWKYTESYGSTPYYTSNRGTSRVDIYRPLYQRTDCPLNKGLLPDFRDLFYEPFYQLMRQQFLAHEMERARELGADRVSALHIEPRANEDFLRVTSPGLRALGDSATGIWKLLLINPDRFRSIAIEELFGRLPQDSTAKLGDWWPYIQQRYSWMDPANRNAAPLP
jgi:hypothetical protein